MLIKNEMNAVPAVKGVRPISLQVLVAQVGLPVKKSEISL